MSLNYTKKISKILKWSTDIIPKLPTSKDSTLVKVVKVFGMLDSINKIRQGGEHGQLYEHLQGLDATSIRNGRFVDMFFETRLHESFQIKKIYVETNICLVSCTAQGIGTLHFIEYHWGQPEKSSEFWASKGFRFDIALDKLWNLYEGQIHLGIKKKRDSQISSTYTGIPQCQDPLLGGSCELLDLVITRQRQFLKDQIQRTYLLVGLQGTGKTTFALRLAQALAGRTLRIDANGLTDVGASDFELILSGLKPSFLIVDDIDKAADIAGAMPTLLGILQDFKSSHSGVTIVLTANDETKLDQAFLRPGRVDEILDFKPPETTERKQILKGYLESFSVQFSEDSLQQLSETTEGLTAAFLRETALQMRYRSLEEVQQLVTRMKRILSPPKEETPKSPPTNISVKQQGMPKA